MNLTPLITGRLPIISLGLALALVITYTLYTFVFKTNESPFQKLLIVIIAYIINMGISLIAFREICKRGKWLSCEKPNDEYVLEDADCMQYSEMFQVLAGKYGATVYLDYPNGLPSDLSPSFQKYVEYRTKKDAESTEHWKSINPNIREVKTEWYNTTIQGILDFIKKQRDIIEETGYLSEELIDEDALEKLEMFKNGIYAKDLNKLMNYYLKLYDETNYLKEFIDSLDEAPCEGEYKGKFSDIKNNNLKRVMFYFT